MRRGFELLWIGGIVVAVGTTLRTPLACLIQILAGGALALVGLILLILESHHRKR